MTGSDQDKNFLTRWSQRKREAKSAEPEPDIADAGLAPVPAVQVEAPPEFDLSSLPRLEDLTSTSDITAFLGKGVPEHLRNAALRKSWALDPAIRNYVNPALEYAYDWNTPGGVPGNSELAAGADIAKMVLQIMGSDQPSAAAVKPLSNDGIAVLEPQIAADIDIPPVRLSEAHAQLDAPDQIEAACSVTPQTSVEHHDSAAPQQVLRRHGSAKPSV
jgi:hypothetical protein